MKVGVRDRPLVRLIHMGDLASHQLSREGQYSAEMVWLKIEPHYLMLL